MTSPGGQYGGIKYSSPTTRALGTITVESYQKVYGDQSKFLSKMAGDVSYLAAVSRRQQQGIDQANENIIQQLQDMISDFITMLGGKGDTGLDFGDLKYVLMAIGTLFGFSGGDGTIETPVNLFTAAWNFFSNWILPGGNFVDTINGIVDNIIGTLLSLFGTTPIVGEAIEQLAVILSTLRDIIDPVADAVDRLFEALSIDLGNISVWGTFWDAFKVFFDILDSVFGPWVDIAEDDLSAIIDFFATWTSPYVAKIVAAIDNITGLINSFDLGAATAEEVNKFFQNIYSFLDNFDFSGDPGSFDPGAAWQTLITNIISGTTFFTDFLGKIQDIIDGIYQAIHGGASVNNAVSTIKTALLNIPGANIVSAILAAIVPNLDASKIVTGTFIQDLIPSLTSLWSGTIHGSLLTGAATIAASLLGNISIGGVSAAISSTIQNAADAVYQAINGGSSTGNTIASIKTALLNIPGANIVSAILASIVPNLDASKITTGAFLQSLIPSLTSLWGGTIHGSLLTGAATIAASLLGNITIGGVSAAISSTIQNAADAVYQAINGGSSTGNTIASIKTALLNIPGANIVSAILAAIVPNLDASKITTGAFLQTLIPSLTSGWGNTIHGSLLTGAATIAASLLGNISIGGVSAAISSTIQNAADAVYQAINGGSSTGNTIASIKTALLNIPGANIVSAVLAAIIPNLDASKIATGTFLQGLIPSLTSLWGNTIHGSLLTGAATIAASLLGNITIGGSGLTITNAVQNSLDAIYQAINGGSSTGNTIASIKTALLNIPGANIVSAVLAAIVPNLDASKITTGTFLSALIPDILRTMSSDLQSGFDNIVNAIFGGTGDGNTATNVGTSIGQIPLNNVLVPANPGGSGLVTHDATSNGTPVTGNGNLSITPWAHTVGTTSGISANFIKVTVTVMNETISPPTVTYAGTSLTLIASEEVADVSFLSKIYTYGLFNPTSGSNNVAVSLTGTGQHIMQASASSYYNVKQIGTITGTVAATSNPSHTISSVTGRVITNTLMVINSATETLSSYSKTSRYNSGSTQNATAGRYMDTLSGDAVSAASQTFSCTASNTSSPMCWASLCVELIPYPVVLLGSGASMNRQGTGTVNASATTTTLPSSFFDHNDANSTSDITADLTNGKFTVSNSGWYIVSLQIDVATDSGGANLHAVIYNGANPAAIGTPAMHAIFNLGSGNSIAQECHVCAPMYIAAGNFVQAGYRATSAITGAFTGEATGFRTSFTIALANRGVYS